MATTSSFAPPTTQDSAGTPIDPARAANIQNAIKDWTRQLIDLGGRNNLLSYRNLPLGTLDLTPGSGARDVAVEQLLARGRARLSNLFEAEELPGAARRARAVREKAKENYEERGLQTLFLAWGMATWDIYRGTATPAAPVLLRGATLTPHGAAAEDFEVQLTDEWEINPVLLHLLASDHQIHPDPDELVELLEADSSQVLPNARAVFHRLAKLAESVAGFTVNSGVVVGNFSYAKLPMVKDLESAIDELAHHELISAITGDEVARQRVVGRIPKIRVDLPDHTPAADEFLVLDADASQNYAITAVLAGADLVVQGPPGTGKSQTIANLIASLAARGRTALFVAEKRAAIDAVLRRLQEVGLGDLVLDLHDGTESRRKLAQDLGNSLAEAASIPAPHVNGVHYTLEARRRALVERREALRQSRAPWNVSINDVHSCLLGIPVPVRSSVRFQGKALERLDEAVYRETSGELREFVALGGLTISSGQSPWVPALRSDTATTREQAFDALQTVHTLRQQLSTAFRSLRSLADEVRLSLPHRVSEWAAFLQLQSGVSRTLDTFSEKLFEAALEEVGAELTPATRGPLGKLVAQFQHPGYRRARKELRQLWLHGKPKARELYAAIQAAAEQQTAWLDLRIDDGKPRRSRQLEAAQAAHAQLLEGLHALSAYLPDGLQNLKYEELSELLQQLVDDQSTLFKLPELHRLQTQLVGKGLGELLEDLAARSLSVELSIASLEHVWLSSILELVMAQDVRVGAFDGDAHSRTVKEFVVADLEHMQHSTSDPTRLGRARDSGAKHALCRIMAGGKGGEEEAQAPPHPRPL